MKQSAITAYQTTTDGAALIVETNDFTLRRDTSNSAVCAFVKGNKKVEIEDLPNQDLVERILRSEFNVRTHRRHGRIGEAANRTVVAGVKLFFPSRASRT